MQHTFEVGDLVYLRIQTYRQTSIKRSGIENLQPRLFGSYKVRRKVGVVEYDPDLPSGREIHNVFHVSCLKRAIGKHIIPIEALPPLDEEGQLTLIPKVVLEVREKRLRKRNISRGCNLGE